MKQDRKLKVKLLFDLIHKYEEADAKGKRVRATSEEILTLVRGFRAMSESLLLFKKAYETATGILGSLSRLSDALDQGISKALEAQKEGMDMTGCDKDEKEEDEPAHDHECETCGNKQACDGMLTATTQQSVLH